MAREIDINNYGNILCICWTIPFNRYFSLVTCNFIAFLKMGAQKGRVHITELLGFLSFQLVGPGD